MSDAKRKLVSQPGYVSFGGWMYDSTWSFKVGPVNSWTLDIFHCFPWSWSIWTIQDFLYTPGDIPLIEHNSPANHLLYMKLLWKIRVPFSISTGNNRRTSEASTVSPNINSLRRLQVQPERSTSWAIYEKNLHWIPWNPGCWILILNSWLVYNPYITGRYKYSIKTQFFHSAPGNRTIATFSFLERKS